MYSVNLTGGRRRPHVNFWLIRKSVKKHIRGQKIKCGQGWTLYQPSEKVEKKGQNLGKMAKF